LVEAVSGPGWHGLPPSLARWWTLGKAQEKAEVGQRGSAMGLETLELEDDSVANGNRQGSVMGAAFDGRDRP